MTRRPCPTTRKLRLVCDLDTCVGCHACVISRKRRNTENCGAPLSDQDPYSADPNGVFVNRAHTCEVTAKTGPAQTVHFPKCCLPCEDAPCPTGASYKCVEDGIVSVNESNCIGCGLCAWACPYGARELDLAAGLMKKCTLCANRIYTDNLPEGDRVRTCPAGARRFSDYGDSTPRRQAVGGGDDLMPEMGTRPVNKYLPPAHETMRRASICLRPCRNLS